MSSDQSTEIVIEIFGEGSTDVGSMTHLPSRADSGVVPILTRRLCGDPVQMRTRRMPYMFLREKRRWQKVRGAKRNAKINGSAGCVFVLDSEGDQQSVEAELTKSRVEYPDFPMAIGIAHPCIEAWLLSDASAIRRGLKLQQKPIVPADPESLPAPQRDRSNNPKAVLAACHTNNRHPNLAEKSAIAEHLILETAASVCPSFAAFVTEIRERIAIPLFPVQALPPELEQTST